MAGKDAVLPSIHFDLLEWELCENGGFSSALFDALSPVPKTCFFMTKY